MNRTSLFVGALLVAAVGTSVASETKPAHKPTSRQQLHAKANATAAGISAAQAAATPEQIDIAKRVLTGRAHCEANQVIDIEPNTAQAGYFKVQYKHMAFNMVPQATTTGAVRLEDQKAGAVWIQIPTKSMLMSNKLGQRLADNCQQPIQRAATDAATAAGANTAANTLISNSGAPSQ
ncbi:MAG: hypothetical protein KGQ77_08125 [Betaproteobacteria bacterium]|nr:hypothetical protein [Betaproteobacteria bacterium]